MEISILLPILVNVLILGIMVAGAFIGRKNGFLYELLKLVTLCGCSIGVYFLNPIVAVKVAEIPFIYNLIDSGLVTVELLKLICFVLLFTFMYIITTIIFRLVKKSYNKKHKIEVKSLNGKKYINTAKPAKIHGLNRKETRKLNKEQKRLAKERKKQGKALKKASKKPLTTKQKVFGALFGILVAFVLGFVITLPMKLILKEIVITQPELVEIEKGYEYTPYGQIEEFIGVIDFIIK